MKSLLLLLSLLSLSAKTQIGKPDNRHYTNLHFLHPIGYTSTKEILFYTRKGIYLIKICIFVPEKV